MAIEPSNNCHSQIVLPDSAASSDPSTSSSAIDSKIGQKRIKRNEHKVIYYSGTFGRVAFKRTKRLVKSPDGCEDTLLNETSTTSYMFPWLPYKLDLHHIWTRYTPLHFSLHVTHIIPEDSRLYDKVTSIYDCGTLQHLQELLTGGQLSFYSKCGDRSLFYVSERNNTGTIHTNICSWHLLMVVPTSVNF